MLLDDIYQIELKLNRQNCFANIFLHFQKQLYNLSEQCQPHDLLTGEHHEVQNRIANIQKLPRMIENVVHQGCKNKRMGKASIKTHKHGIRVNKLSSAKSNRQETSPHFILESSKTCNHTRRISKGALIDPLNPLHLHTLIKANISTTIFRLPKGIRNAASIT